jgi:hypothetical protein
LALEPALPALLLPELPMPPIPRPLPQREDDGERPRPRAD